MMALATPLRVAIDDARIEDADALADIHGGAFARAWDADDFAGLIGERTVLALTARRQAPLRPQRVVGFLLVRAMADESEVLTLAVEAGYRRRGLGRRMMEDALRRLYRERIASCFLEVDAGNAAALRLYRSLGFAVVGERKGYYARTGGPAAGALVMRLHLR